MDERDRIESFGDMVEATEKLTKPWRNAFFAAIGATLVTNILWAVIVWFLVHYAYMTPTDIYQEQDLTGQVQTQSYSQGDGSQSPYVTDGG